MGSTIKGFKFKQSAKLKIEVVPLRTLTETSRPHLVTPHRTDFYHVFLFEDCTPIHLVDFKPIKVNPYSLLFIDKERVHQFDQLLHYEGRVLIFTEDFFHTHQNDGAFLRSSILFNELTDKPGLKLRKQDFDRFQKICDSIVEELSMEHPEPVILKNHLHNFLLLAEREKRMQGFTEMKKGPDLDYTLLFRNLLEKQFKNNKNVSTYADSLHVSVKRLGQATSNVVGKTPKEMIDERVLLEAKRLLVHGNQSIKEIGFQLGFEEPTNFIKYFRKHTQKTPVVFRESFLS